MIPSRTLDRRILAALVLTIATPLPGHAAGPSFDCTGSLGPVERAICGSPTIARLDARIAVAYRRAMTAWSADPIARDLLRSAQRTFLDRRETALAAPYDALRSLHEAQVRVLESLDFTPRTGFEGGWSNLAGGIDVFRDATGLVLWGNSVEPIFFRWICDTQENAVVAGTTLITPPEAVTPGHAGWSIRIERDGAALRLHEVAPPATDASSDGGSTGQSPRCGRNGRFDGVYFPTHGTPRR